MERISNFMFAEVSVVETYSYERSVTSMSYALKRTACFQGDESLQRSERTYTFVNGSRTVLHFSQIEQAGGNQLPREHAFSHGADFHARGACSPAESEKK